MRNHRDLAADESGQAIDAPLLRMLSLYAGERLVVADAYHLVFAEGAGGESVASFDKANSQIPAIGENKPSRTHLVEPGGFEEGGNGRIVGFGCGSKFKVVHDQGP